MKLKKLTLRNFRNYEKFEIDFNEKLNVIVAENGAGKTTILDAIAIALSPFIGEFSFGKMKSFKNTDARLTINKNSKSIMKEMESNYPIRIEAIGVFNNKNEEWSRSLNKRGLRTTNKDAKNLSNYAKELQNLVRLDTISSISLPIISLYGTNRLCNIKGKAFKEANMREYAYLKVLEHTLDYVSFYSWFINESKAEYDNLINRIQNAENIKDYSIEESITLKNTREAVNTCLKISEWNNLRYDSTFNDITVTHPIQGTVPISYLSDGVQGMLALTADIAYRCSRLNPHLDNAPKETEGIVMIDEVDLHLHPRWQQMVLPSLQEAFPLIQFIVTTHSPQVITSVKNQSIQIISDNKLYSAPLGTEGAEASRVLKRVFGVELRPKDNSITIKLNKYLDLVYDDKWDEKNVLEEREELDTLFNGEEPALMEADLYIENRKWELEIEEDS